MFFGNFFNKCLYWRKKSTNNIAIVTTHPQPKLNSNKKISWTNIEEFFLFHKWFRKIFSTQKLHSSVSRYHKNFRFMFLIRCLFIVQFAINMWVRKLAKFLRYLHFPSPPPHSLCGGCKDVNCSILFALTSYMTQCSDDKKNYLFGNGKTKHIS